MAWVARALRRLRGVDARVRPALDAHLAETYGPGAPALSLAHGGHLAEIAAPVIGAVAPRLEGGIQCGLAPTSAFTAYAQPVEGGAIVVLSTGFLQAAVDFAGLLVRVMRTDLAGRPPLDPAAGPEILRRIVAATRAPAVAVVPPKGALPGQVRPALGALDGTLARIEADFIISTVRFAVAHELAHVLLGHFDQARRPFGPEAAALPSLQRLMLRHAFSWVDELDADAEALRILGALPHAPWEQPYFGLVLLSELIDAAVEQYPWASHPHPVLRRSAGIGTVQAEPLTTAFPLCDPLVATIERLRHGPSAPADPAELDRLARWTKAAEGVTLDQGERVEGVRILDTDRIEAFLAADFERARGIVAHLALAMLQSGEVMLGFHLMRFGTYYALFGRAFAADPRRAAVEATVAAAVPELQRRLAVWRTARVDSAEPALGPG